MDPGSSIAADNISLSFGHAANEETPAVRTSRYAITRISKGTRAVDVRSDEIAHDQVAMYAATDTDTPAVVAADDIPLLCGRLTYSIEQCPPRQCLRHCRLV